MDKYFSSSIICEYISSNLENNSLYSLSLNSISNSDFSVVNDTDIFTWGLFLDNTQNFIFINNEDMLVDKCIFKKGLIKLVAKREK